MHSLVSKVKKSKPHADPHVQKFFGFKPCFRPCFRAIATEKEKQLFYARAKVC